jgi:predicted phosphodiesterase
VRIAVAVLNDIHGNLPALEAVLDEVRGAAVDRIVVGGDVFPGPMAHLVLRRLVTCGTPVDFIYGNGDVTILDHVAGRAPKLPESYRPSVRWNAEQLEPSEVRAIAGWPMTRRAAVPPIGDILFCHATPRNENEIFTELTPEDRLIPVFDPANVALVVCGHTHIVMDRTIGRTRVVNPGSVGMPFGPAGADWMILGPDIEFRHTNYDLQRAAERVRASAYPGAEEFATKYVLQPPSADDMLKMYGQHELRS